MDYNKNYYQVLGVDKNSAEADIKKAFRNLSKTHHPDKGGDANKFKEINEAHSILTDVQKKNQFDANSPHGKNYRVNTGFGGFGGNNRTNPFNEAYGNPYDAYKTNFGNDIEEMLRRSGFKFQQEVIEELDIDLVINISLEDIYNNKAKEFTYIRNVHCTTCDGTGEMTMNGHVFCHHCNGKGRVMNPNGRESICGNCSGSGKITKKVCDDCNGSKVKLKKETLPLKGLFSLNEKQEVYLHPNLGNASKYYKSKVGKLVLHLNPIIGDRYKKSGKDLYYKTKLDFKTAILGGLLEYEHLDGKIYSIKIPEKTNTAARFKLKEKGLLINTNGNRGDLFIDIEIYVDYNKLKEEDIEILKKLK